LCGDDHIGADYPVGDHLCADTQGLSRPRFCWSGLPCLPWFW
jgi:hypothetical protein